MEILSASFLERCVWLHKEQERLVLKTAMAEIE